MSQQQSDVNKRGIGLELRRLREERGLTVHEVGARMDTSGSTISRMETGKKKLTSEDVASYLTVIQVFGVERAELLDRARRHDQPDMLESATSTEQSRSFLNFEQQATRIVDFGLMLVPGLGQTADYAHATLSALRVRDSDDDIEPWVGQRMRRQAILTRRNPPQLHWILTELGLRQPIGGGNVMHKQLRHLIDLAERQNITINVLPTTVADHPGLLGQFVIMEFTEDPTVVYVEDKTTGIFLDDLDKVALYKLTAERLTELALDEQDSIRLLEAIAEDLHGE